MTKLIKSLFHLIAAFLIILGIYGHHNNWSANDYIDFFEKNIFAYFENNGEKINDENSFFEKNKAPNIRNKKSYAIPKDPFLNIDKHARNCPALAETDIITLANYLQEKADNDLEKARAIYVWLTENVRYDDDGYNSGNYSNSSAEAVLENRLSVCAGYANLYEALGKEMGLNIKKVSGYAKGYGYSKGDSFDDTDHAWNIIGIAGDWKVFDATWGAGSGKNINGKLVSEKEFDGYWFNVDPYEAIFTHMPEDEVLSFVEPLMSLKKYEQMPYLSSAFFKLGFDGKEIYDEAYYNSEMEFPKCYNVKTYVEVMNAPLNKNIQLNEWQEFELFVPKGKKVALINSSAEWIFFKKEKGVFYLGFAPDVKGELKISVQYDKNGKSFSTILEYNVIKSDFVT